MKSYKDNEKEIMARFDEKFIVKDRAGRKRFMTMNELSLADNIKSFLLSAMQSAREATLEEVGERVEKLIPNYDTEQALMSMEGEKESIENWKRIIAVSCDGRQGAIAKKLIDIINELKKK